MILDITYNYSFSELLILHRVVRSLKSIPGDSGHNAGDTMHRLLHGTIMHTLTHPFTHYSLENANQPPTLDWGRKLE